MWIHVTPKTNVKSILNYELKTTQSKWSGCWEAEMCDGSGAGRVKGTNSETTMQICRHFVWQATTLLCIYAKPGKTLCTQACCQSGVMLEWWHPMGDPCLGQTSHFIQAHTHEHWQKLSHVAHITSQGSNVAGCKVCPLFLRNLEMRQKLNILISETFFIPTEVKSTWLALWTYSAAGLFGHH